MSSNDIFFLTVNTCIYKPFPLACRIKIYNKPKIYCDGLHHVMVTWEFIDSVNIGKTCIQVTSDQ